MLSSAALAGNSDWSQAVNVYIMSHATGQFN